MPSIRLSPTLSPRDCQTVGSLLPKISKSVFQTANQLANHPLIMEVDDQSPSPRSWEPSVLEQRVNTTSVYLSAGVESEGAGGYPEVVLVPLTTGIGTSSFVARRKDRVRSRLRSSVSWQGVRGAWRLASSITLPWVEARYVEVAQS